MCIYNLYGIVITLLDLGYKFNKYSNFNLNTRQSTLITNGVYKRNTMFKILKNGAITININNIIIFKICTKFVIANMQATIQSKNY